MDQRNRFRETIEDDGVVLGARSATHSPTVVERYGLLGLDFVWLDFEHAGPSPDDTPFVENLTRAAEVGGTELLVRLPSGDPALIRKVLDAGVRNLLIPRVDAVEEVERAVRATRFSAGDGPGDRGLAGARSSRWGTVPEYVDREDASVCLGVMIETAEAVAALDEILAVPDLGFVFVGPSDLSVQLGHPAEQSHPAVREEIDAIVETCLESAVPVGGIAHDPADAVEAVGDGYRIVRIGGDLEAATKTLTGRLADIREAL